MESNNSKTFWSMKYPSQICPSETTCTDGTLDLATWITKNFVYIGIPYIKVALFSISTIRGTTQSIKCCVANRDIFPAFCSNVVGGVSAIEHTPSLTVTLIGEGWRVVSKDLVEDTLHYQKYPKKVVNIRVGYIHPRYRYIKRWFVPYI